MNVLKACKYGLTLFNTRDMYVGKSLDQYGEYAEAEVDLFKDLIKEGDTVYDIGANIGSHTLSFAQLVTETGTVVAFEPQRRIFYMLCANMSLNNINHVHCMPTALSNIAGSVKVPELNFKQSGNFGALDLQNNKVDVEHSIAQVIRLDDLNPTSCDFIKIDVEGMESRVILGASKTLDEFKPLLYVEDDRENRSKDLVTGLHAAGYRVYLHTPPLFREDNYFGNKTNVFGGIIAVNLFCYHKSQEISLDFEKHGLSEIKQGENNDFFERHVAPSREKNLEQATRLAANEMTHLAKIHSETMFDFDEALKCLKKANELEPNAAFTHGNLCSFYTTHMRFKEAMPYAQRCIELDPENVEAYVNLGICYAGLKDYKTSVSLYEEVLKEYPDNNRAKFHRGYDKLMQRDFSGFEDYEARFDLFNIAKICKERYGDTPMWEGQELKETDRLLLFGEQGAGDMFQLARYLPMIKEEKGNPHIILELWAGMENVMARCKGMDEIYILNRQDALPEDTPRFDYVCSLFSIPYLFNMKNEEDSPVDVPYVYPVKTRPKDTDEELKNLLDSDRKMRVAICWAGNSLHKNDRIRSCWKKNFKPLEEIKDIQLYSLCMSEPKRTWIDKGEVDLLEDSEEMDVIDLSPYIENWNDTAQILENIDLVVTVDTGLAHLAGAMDKVVYLALPFINDWRWYLDRDTSMWYPTMKIFRQPEPYDWDSVFQEIKGTIQDFITKYDK